MDRPVHILMLEDDPSDAELVQRELRKAGLNPVVQWAQDKAAFLAAIQKSAFDLVLSDYSLPGFDGLTALTLARRKSADVPVIIVSGAIGEEVAIEALKTGATDYVLKSRLSRLGPVVRRALQEAERLLEKKRADEELRRNERALRENEERFKLLSETASRLLEAENPQRIVKELCHKVMAHLDCQVFLNLLVDEKAGRLHLNACAGIPKEQARQIEWLDFGEAICGCVARDGMRFMAEGILSASDPRTDWVRSCGIDAYVCHPLSAQGTIIGTLSFGAKTRPRFREEDLSLTKTVADQVAVAMQRIRAARQLRELNATLETKVTQRTAELQHRAKQLQKLAMELSEAEDRERKHVAEILHDDLQQMLVAAKFHLTLLGKKAKRNASLQVAVAQIDQMLKDAIDKSRSLSHELSPAVLHHEDLAQTLRWLADDVHTKHGLLVHVCAATQVCSQSDAIKAFLYKAAQELLFNVVKHARVNEAGIRVRRLGRCIGLSVCDRGRGFNPQDLKVTAGFGLLSIRERIELLGGRMKIKSAKDKGSTFVIVVPDGQEPENRRQMTDDSAVRRPPASAPRLRVLLADDHGIVREGLALLLNEEPSIEVVGEAANGREAVDLAGQLEPDVVIMDVAMPLINGEEATRQIKRHLPKTRVVALSMYEEPDTVETMRRAGADAYVLKTAPPDQLLAAVRGQGPTLQAP